MSLLYYSVIGIVLFLVISNAKDNKMTIQDIFLYVLKLFTNISNIIRKVVIYTFVEIRDHSWSPDLPKKETKEVKKVEINAETFRGR